MVEVMMCDVCTGDGRKDCICGGTGKMQDAFPPMRKAYFDCVDDYDEVKDMLKRCWQI